MRGGCLASGCRHNAVVVISPMSDHSWQLLDRISSLGCSTGAFLSPSVDKQTFPWYALRDGGLSQPSREYAEGYRVDNVTSPASPTFLIGQYHARQGSTAERIDMRRSSKLDEAGSFGHSNCLSSLCFPAVRLAMDMDGLSTYFESTLSTASGVRHLASRRLADYPSDPSSFVQVDPPHWLD